MKKLQFKSINYVGIINCFIVAFLLLSSVSYAQVGINTTDPNATLDIRSTNQATPDNNDGILIPQMDNFPTTNPTANQDGMLVFVTGNSVPNRGFYYWDNATTGWVLITGMNNGGNTLDQAYDQDGVGLGKKINATDGAVRINGEDGFLVTGTFGSGNIIDAEVTGPGTRLFFNPNKSAFRAGSVFDFISAGDEWNDINIGAYSTAFGINTIASGMISTAFGSLSSASGGTATAFGSGTTASGDIATAFGSSTTASGSSSTAFGVSSSASGTFSTAFGVGSIASETYSTAFGLASVASGVTSVAFGNQNTAMGFRSMAFGSFTMASGTVSTAFGLQSLASGQNSTAFGEASEASGDYSTAFGRLTEASELTATAFGSNSIASGSIATAFGSHSNASGQNSTAFGIFSTASGNTTTAFGSSTTATGDYSTAFGQNTIASQHSSTAFGSNTEASGIRSTAFGSSTTASGDFSTAFGGNATASGNYSAAYGRFTTASSSNATAFGYQTVASNEHATTFGQYTAASGYASTAFGFNTLALSSYETAIGYYNSTYLPIVSSFGFDEQDRLFVIGNGIDNTQRSNALTIYKSGLMNINDAYNMPLTDGTANQVMTTDGSGVVSFQDVNGLTGNTLGEAYNQGGFGAGRIINTTNGAVEIHGRGGFLVESVSQTHMLYVDGLNNEIGIATDTPTATLSVNGTANKLGGGTWAVFSDARLKENVSDYNEGLELITKIRPINFSYNAKMKSLLGKNHSLNNLVYQGVIAQDLQKIAPDMVREVILNNEYFLEVDPNKFTYALINSVQEQQKQIVEQQDKIEDLEKQLKNQQNEIDAIKALLKMN